MAHGPVESAVGGPEGVALDSDDQRSGDEEQFHFSANFVNGSNSTEDDKVHDQIPVVMR